MCACLQVELFWDVMLLSAPGLFRYVSTPSLFAIRPLFSSPFAYSVNGFEIVFSINFLSKLFCGSYGINLSMGRNTGRGKVAYSWISPDPVKAGPTLGVCCCCCCCCCLLPPPYYLKQLQSAGTMTSPFHYHNILSDVSIREKSDMQNMPLINVNGLLCFLFTSLL